jgi:gamma-glutamyltranspeptidase/glutathione hydrolase
MRDVDGLLVAGDLAGHRTRVLAPVSTTYRGYTVYEQPPPSQGFVLLEEMSILEGFDIAALDVSSADAIHLMVEAKKLAFADRDMLYGDQRFISVPLNEMLSKEHAAALRAKIDPRRAALLRPGSVPIGPASNDTTYLAVADAEGNCVSYIHSLFGGIGTVASGTGVLLNDRMRGFSLDPSSPDSLRPGKFPTNTLNSYMVFRDGLPRLIGGTPGGHAQVQTSFQILSDLLDHGSSLVDAIERPRWRNGDRSGSPSLELAVEGRVEATVIEDLVSRGHRIRTLGNWSPWTGSVKLIEFDQQQRTFTGAVDPRIEAAVAGW